MMDCKARPRSGSYGLDHLTGPRVNLGLWGEILQLILTSSCTFRWVKVPSHVDIEGNEKADNLAEKGCPMSPLYNTV